MKSILITGSAGLIGLEASLFYLNKGYHVFGIDTNMREVFFGPAGSVKKNIDFLSGFSNYTHLNGIDVRNREKILELFRTNKFDAIIHCAAQPSHDLAAKIPFDDFDTNANGTLNLLEATRLTNINTPFIFMSTNKVYGDNPNKLQLKREQDRFVAVGEFCEGINENMSIDNCIHSIFGVSKVAADVMVQEYGKYFGMQTCTFRGGCLTGSHHSSVKLHGFLSYIVKCAVKREKYTIIGHDGFQVRDQIHSSDVVQAFDMFIEKPTSGEAYNLGGCKENSASILEVINYLNSTHGIKIDVSYEKNPRIGDHMWYITDMTKFKNHYPNFKIKKSLSVIIDEIVKAERVF